MKSADSYQVRPRDVTGALLADIFSRHVLLLKEYKQGEDGKHSTYQAPSAVFADSRFRSQFPVVHIFATAIAADISNASFVVVTSSHTGIAIRASVILTGE